jgi:Raf kinase inhibitor-like YbhB/YbcL family protein
MKASGKPMVSNIFKISSPAFASMENIPRKYTCMGADVNPPMDISEIPEGTKSLALVVDDPDAPNGVWVHWLVWNIPPIKKINEKESPGKEGINDFKTHHYRGPCTPSGTHRYFFKLYALNTLLALTPDSQKIDLENAMKGHITGSCELIGLFCKGK